MSSIRTLDDEVVEKTDNIALVWTLLRVVFQPLKNLGLVILPGDSCNIDFDRNITTRYSLTTVRGQEE